MAMGLNLIFSAPYSYSAAPIETLFSNLKLGELNPERLTTGKRYVAYPSSSFLTSIALSTM